MSRAAALFDLDGTLLAAPSTEVRFVRRLVRRGMLPAGRLAVAALRMAAARLTGRTAALAASKAYLGGLPCAPLEAEGDACVHGEVIPQLRPALLARLESHRAAGHALILLTGTPDFLAAEVARILRFEWVVAARLERRGGLFTGRVLPPYPHGAGKVAALDALADRHALDLAASHAYANHRTDAAHLERVGWPHAVHPDRGLRRRARERGWPVEDEEDRDRHAAERWPPG